MNMSAYIMCLQQWAKKGEELIRGQGGVRIQGKWAVAWKTRIGGGGTIGGDKDLKKREAKEKTRMISVL